MSCGSRGFHPYPFYHLIRVYDTYIWLAVAILCAFAFPVMVVFSTGKFRWATSLHPENIICYSLAACKMLLEQGESFMQKWHKSTLRLGTGAFLLGCIVLSNGYKNSNVYDMIAQRAPLLYETLEQLIQDKFMIFSRISNVEIIMGNYRPVELVLNVFRHEIGDINGRVVLVLSEVGILHFNNDTLRKSNEIENLYYSSMIHTTLQSRIKNLVESLGLFNRDDLGNSENDGLHLHLEAFDCDC